MKLSRDETQINTITRFKWIYKYFIVNYFETLKVKYSRCKQKCCQDFDECTLERY